MLVLDEPTNHLDLESREALEDALRAFPGSLLLISHDRALLDAVGSRTLSIEDGGVRSYMGGWAEYLEAREARRAAATDRKQAEKAEAKAAKAGRPRGRNGSRPGPSKNAQRAQKDLEREIEAAEVALHSIEDELADPAAWSNPERSAEASERHLEAKRRVEELYARWEAAAT
jgi:ATP-binding cassette subfamily F protein 3